MRRAQVRGGDAVAATLVWAGALVVVGIAAWIVTDLVRGGAGRLSWSFLVESPQDAGRRGGIAPVIVSTLGILAVCMAVTVPLGVGCAAFLSEVTRRGGRAARVVSRSLDLLAATPSIVLGLFGNALFCQLLGLGFSILAGGLTLACMVLPLVIRATEEGFRAVPDSTRHAAAALGMSRSGAFLHLLLPAAAPGLAVGIVLGLGRATAETAALLFTSGYVSRMPTSLLDSGRTLAVHIYDLAMHVPGGEASAHASALVLFLVLLVLGAATTGLADFWLGRRIVR